MKLKVFLTGLWPIIAMGIAFVSFFPLIYIVGCNLLMLDTGFVDGPWVISGTPIYDIIGAYILLVCMMGLFFINKKKLFPDLEE